MMLDAITHLPDRVGWLWFKHLSAEALKITTDHLAMPQGEDLRAAVHSIRRDARSAGVCRVSSTRAAWPSGMVSGGSRGRVI